MAASNEATRMIVAVFLERQEQAPTPRSCRDLYWNKALASRVEKGGIRTYEQGSVAYGEYLARAQDIISRHVNAYMALPDACVDVRVSKLGYEDADARLFTEVFSGVQVHRH